jgi:hypothetical protein
VILSVFCGQDIDDLPSESTAAKFVLEMGELARQHIAEEVNKADNVTLQRDATSKQGHHFYGMQLNSESGPLTVGLREIPSGTAESYVTATMEVFKDVQDADPDINVDILSTVKNFMTDRSATETKVNRLVSELRAQRIGNVMDEYEEMNDEERKELKTVNEFKCAVHPVLQFAEVSDKEVKTFEDDIVFSKQLFRRRGESVTLSLIRGVSKLFHKDGAGDPLMSREYLRSVGVNKLPVENFRGSRFNIYFHNAAGTYFLKDHVIKYLETTKLTMSPLQAATVEVLKTPQVMNICRALGIVGKMVTLPYWRLACSAENAMAMQEPYNRLVNALQIWIDDPSTLLNGEGVEFVPLSAAEDAVNVYLFQSTDSDEGTACHLKALCIALLAKSKKLFLEHLPGGSLYNNNSVQGSESCPPHNIGVERLMAQLDRKIRQAPNSNDQTIESTIMFRQNQVSSWLEESNNRHSKITRARISARKKQTLIKVRKTLLRQHHQDALKRRAMLKEQRTRNTEHRQMKVQKGVQQSGGLWTSSEDMNTWIDGINNKDALEKVKDQLRGRKELKSQPKPPPELFMFSRYKKTHTLDILKDHLLQIMTLQPLVAPQIQQTVVTVPDNRVSCENIASNPQSMVGRYVNHCWDDKGTDTVYPGKIINLIETTYEVQQRSITKF